jgi:hypothetical protein
VIELREPSPPASSEDLAAADARLAELGHRIPPSYRAFLADHDGGMPVRDTFHLERNGQADDDFVQQFLGVRPVPSPGVDLVKATELLAEGLLPGLLPIARDPVGNYIVIDTREDRDGPVLLWDHEEIPAEPSEENVYELSPDLEAFLDGLTEFTPPEPNPKKGGWRRMFGR